MCLLYSQVFEKPTEVVHRLVLGVRGLVGRYVGWQIAPRAVGNDPVSPREESHLRLPGPVVSGELVAPYQRVALSMGLEVDIDSVDRRLRHGASLARINGSLAPSSKRGRIRDSTASRFE